MTQPMTKPRVRICMKETVRFYDRVWMERLDSYIRSSGMTKNDALVSLIKKGNESLEPNADSKDVGDKVRQLLDIDAEIVALEKELALKQEQCLQLLSCIHNLRVMDLSGEHPSSRQVEAGLFDFLPTRFRKGTK